MTTLLLQALNECPPQLVEPLLPYLTHPHFRASFSASEVATLQHLSGLSPTELALALLPIAASYARAPLSQFNVGAIAQGESGRWYLGANMEFPTVPLQQTVHAEQSAITHAWLNDERRLTALTVNYTPCGHCRQFMNELQGADQLTLHLPDRSPQPLSYYLPNAFGPKDLGIENLLLDRHDHPFHTHPDPLVQAAAEAASQSYAPYTHAYSGIALALDTQQWITGRYAENAAFNPALPPLQSALIMLQLQGHQPSSIRRAVLVETPNAVISQHLSSAATLSALGCDNFTTMTLALK